MGLKDPDVMEMVGKLEELYDLTEQELIELKNQCADECSNYCDCMGVMNPMYYLWTGMWHTVEKEINERIEGFKDNISTIDKELDALHLRRKELENKASKLR